MHDSPLLGLREHGQGVWLDFIRRDSIESGELERRIADSAVTGVVSDIRVLAKLIEAGEYDRELGDLSADASDLAMELAVIDARRAADALTAVHVESEGRDGHVSIGVAPELAHDADGILRAAQKMVAQVERPNVLVQVVGNRSGCAAIEALVSEGHGVHASLLFSPRDYRRVGDAFIEGLSRFVAAGGDPGRVSTVAAFHLAPADVLVDDLLGELIRSSEGDTSRAESLLGSVAVATAKLSFEAHTELLDSDRWQSLARHGARAPRLMWAVTSSKNPIYRGLRYVEELIGPGTISLMSLNTLTTFRRHGRVDPTLGRSIGKAREVLADLARVGIDLDQAGKRLRQEALRGLVSSFESAAAAAARRQRGGAPDECAIALAEQTYEARVLPAVKELGRQELVARLWAKEATLWSDDADAREAIHNRLGWLDVVEAMLEECKPAAWFGEALGDADVEQAVLLGMGGSSLCAEVCRALFGADSFTVLDSTVPAAVQAVAERIDPARTLVLVSSKSGTTTETRALADRFYAQATPMLARPGERFVAITDPGTPLEQMAYERAFRRVWLNPTDIGGRYSALSFFGLVPMAVMGIDVEKMVDRAFGMTQQCAASVPARSNPGLVLGASLYEALRDGRDKVTFVMHPRVTALGTWLEQLIAESTGKHGTGLIPVAGEPLGKVAAYGGDRVFVQLRLAGDEAGPVDRRLDQLAAAGHPVIRLGLRDAYDLGAEFFRWEMAVAVAGSLMGIDPFDEPDVKKSKDRTCALLRTYEQQGRLSAEEPAYSEGTIAVYADLAADPDLAAAVGGNTNLVGWLRAHLGRARPPDYVVFQAFLAPDEQLEKLVTTARQLARDHRRVATTFGWGPRYLHSTGQLHKGGPDSGIFVVLTAEDVDDIDVPARDYAFSTLARAQALGDLQALRDGGRRVLRIHFTGSPLRGLRDVVLALEEAFTAD